MPGSDGFDTPPTAAELAGGGFDTPPTPEELAGHAGPSQLESGVRGLAQGATLGFGDELTGGAEALLDKIRGHHEELGKLYAKHRDEARKANEAAKAANPLTYGGHRSPGASRRRWRPGGLHSRSNLPLGL
jgi:hypothetical protein